MPCETPRGCPYDPSPGECELAAENVRAVHLWQRLQTLGSGAWDLLTADLRPADADLLVEQLHTLSMHHAALERERAAQRQG